MSHRQVEIEEFLRLGVDIPVLDVRSPSEYQKAHIPGAYSFPLFSDEERSSIGTLYKQKSRQSAIRRGLEFFGPRMTRFLDEAEILVRQHAERHQQQEPSHTILIHCWRGGMRSAGMAWLLDLYGYRVLTLQGGYKSFRSWVRLQFTKNWKLRCLGGYTGSGKTEILQCMKRKGVAVIDLESMAAHKGSAFGAIGQSVSQPSQELFENRLAMALWEISRMADPDGCPGTIWVEDESQRIGTVNIPQAFWEQMRVKELVYVDIPFDRRLAYIVMGYGKQDRSLLLAAISRLQKKLGGQETKNALTLLLDDDVLGCFQILLKYYDKLYVKALDKKKGMLLMLDNLVFEEIQPEHISDRIIERYGHE